MKKLMVIIGCIATALSGCVTHQAVSVEACNVPCVPGITNLEARHAHLKSILGIDDAVLADTNRFVLGDGNYSQSAQWSTGFGIIQH